MAITLLAATLGLRLSNRASSPALRASWPQPLPRRWPRNPWPSEANGCSKPEPPARRRGPAYFAPVAINPNPRPGTGHIVALEIKSTIGGEAWGTALVRMQTVAGLMLWGKRNGAQPGDYIPRTVDEAHRLLEPAGNVSGLLTA